MKQTRGKGRRVLLSQVQPRVLNATNYVDSGGGKVWDMLTPEAVGTRKLILGRSSYDPGTVTWAKVHTFEEAVYVISGRGIFWVEGESIPLEPGTALFIPPKAKHYLRNTGPEPLVFFFAAAPPPGIAPKIGKTGTSSKRVRAPHNV